MSAINANYKRNTVVGAVSRCCVCKQTRPCCRQTLFELNEHGTHDNLVRPIRGPLKEAWGLGSVYVTCCGVVYGMYYDKETDKYDFMFLGNDQDQAMSRVNHVKSFFAN